MEFVFVFVLAANCGGLSSAFFVLHYANLIFHSMLTILNLSSQYLNSIVTIL